MLPGVPILVAIVLLASSSSVRTTPFLLALRPIKFPILEILVAIKLQGRSGDGAATLELNAAKLLLWFAPRCLPIVEGSIAIEGITCPASVSTTLMLLPLWPSFPLVEIDGAIDRRLGGISMIAAEPTVRTTPAFLLRCPRGPPRVQILPAIECITTDALVHAAPASSRGGPNFKVASASWWRRRWCRWWLRRCWSGGDPRGLSCASNS